ncbi:MAG: hypothetical protein R2881_02385 [Eubacteriales bacterium]
MQSFGSSEHPHWGLVDSVLIGEQEVYLMYFTQSKFTASIDAILRGERTERGELLLPDGSACFHSGDACVF